MKRHDVVDAERYRFIRDHLTQMHSPQMDGQHCWRFIYGWLGGKMRGPTFDDGIDAAKAAYEKHREEWNK